MLVGAQNLGAQYRFIETELTVEFGYRRWSRLETDNGIDAFGMFGYFVGQPSSTPNVDLLDCSTVFANNVEECIQCWSNRAFVKGGVEDDHNFVWTHENLITSSGLYGHDEVRGRRIACVGNRLRLPDAEFIQEIVPRNKPEIRRENSYSLSFAEIFVGSVPGRFVGFEVGARVVWRLRIVLNEQLTGLRRRSIN